MEEQVQKTRIVPLIINEEDYQKLRRAAEELQLRIEDFILMTALENCEVEEKFVITDLRY